MIKDVQVNIKADQPTGTAPGFGFPLFLTNTTIDFQVYNRIESFIADNHPEDLTAAVQKMMMQDSAPNIFAIFGVQGYSAIETELTKTLHKGWRQLVVVDQHLTDANLKIIADFIEITEDKIGFVQMNNQITMSVKGYSKTQFVYCPEAYANAAIVGATASKDASSFTYKNQKLKGIIAEDTSKVEVDLLHDEGIITVLEKYGYVVTSDGFAGNGEQLDIIDAQDYVVSEIERRVQLLLINNDKLPFTDKGIVLIDNETTGVLLDCFNKGIIAADEDGLPLFSTNFGGRETVTENDRKLRNYPNGGFSFDIAGAIHNVTINGTMSF